MTREKFDVKDIQQEYYLLTWLSDSSGIVYISIVVKLYFGVIWPQYPTLIKVTGPMNMRFNYLF